MHHHHITYWWKFLNASKPEGLRANIIKISLQKRCRTIDASLSEMDWNASVQSKMNSWRWNVQRYFILLCFGSMSEMSPMHPSNRAPKVQVGKFCPLDLTTVYKNKVCFIAGVLLELLFQLLFLDNQRRLSHYVLYVVYTVCKRWQ